MQVPNCVMTVLLYVFNFMCLLMVFLSLAPVTLGNNFLNMCQGIMLPSLPISILYGIVSLLLPVCISNSAVNIDQFLFIYTESILTISISPLLYSLDISCSILFITLLLLLQLFYFLLPTLTLGIQQSSHLQSILCHHPMVHLTHGGCRHIGDFAPLQAVKLSISFSDAIISTVLGKPKKCILYNKKANEWMCCEWQHNCVVLHNHTYLPIKMKNMNQTKLGLLKTYYMS